MLVNQAKITAISPQPPYQERSCSLEEVLSRVQQGEIIIIRDSEFMKEKVQQFNQIAFDAINKSHPDIELQSWKKLHLYLQGEQLLGINQKINQLTEPFLLQWAKEFVSDFLQYRDRFYLYSDTIVRTFVPYQVFAENQSTFLPHLGTLQLQSPHRDSWGGGFAETAINLWIATDEVLLGNSMLFYPQQWGKHIPLPTAITHIERNHPLEKPLRFALQPGDTLLFSVEHLHSSEINTTEDTRCAVTMRFSLTFPQSPSFDQWRSWYDSRWVSTRWKWLAQARSHFSHAHIGYRLKNQKKRWQRIKNHLQNRFFPQTTPEKTESLNITPNVDLKAHPHVIQIKDAHTCVVNTEDGMIEFPRYCPHQGGDLAQGYIEEGKLYCAWHNLAFDLETGKPNCAGIPPLSLNKQIPNP
ncbi:MAG: Rieske 2Fe-2S domain-containing protein [Kamptonema sp. SIO1D9]|nr:Rieske 2Fe-2S domain-containing protein [Kamptonema sp. SIO1D9]